MTPGQIAVQAAHVALAFSLAHPDLTREWHDISETLVLLSLKDEDELYALVKRFSSEGYLYQCFREPDLSGTLTAVAVEPSAHRLLRKLPLALRGGEHDER